VVSAVVVVLGVVLVSAVAVVLGVDVAAAAVVAAGEADRFAARDRERWACVRSPEPDAAGVLFRVLLSVTVRSAVRRDTARACPLAMLTVISTHSPANMATDPLTTRRRITAIRASRACLIACASAEFMDVRIRSPRRSSVWIA
jgi:hypothetical protein